MGQRYTGRHRPAVRGARPVTSAQRLLPSKVVRRPLLTTAVALALVGASAAGYAKAGESVNGSQAAFRVAVSSGLADESVPHQHEQLEHAEYRRTALMASATRESLTAQRDKVAAAALAAQRRAEADRAARSAERVAIVANAQADPKSVARLMLADYGWSASQFSCLSSLWGKESGWSYTATNAGSGAYGIPQSLPASKMATVAADYRTNPVTQITWGLRYIKGSYGSPCSAWAHSQAANWY